MKYLFLKCPFLLIFLLLLLNCNNSSNENHTYTNEPEPPETNTENWYILENGHFTKFDFPSELRKGEMLPWTVQERVSDFVIFNNNVIAAVNGFGISIIKIHENTKFEYLYNQDIYQYNTITKLFSVDNSVLCHFYFNSILNINGNSNTGSLNTMQYFYSETPEPVDIPFKKNNPEWEIISMLPVKDNCFFLEWKNLEGNTVNFRYSKIYLNANTEELITRDQYRNQFAFTDYKSINQGSRIIKIIELQNNTII